MSVTLIVGAILYIGTPYLAIIASENELTVESNPEANDLLATIKFGGESIFTVTSKDTSLVYDGKEKSLDDWFPESSHSKKIELIKGSNYQELRVYFSNQNGEIRSAGYTFKTEGRKINIGFFAETAESQKLVNAKYSLNFGDQITEIILKNSILKNDGRSVYTIWDYAVPYEKFQTFNFVNGNKKGSAKLTFAGGLRVDNLYGSQQTHIYMPAKNGFFSPVSIVFSENQEVNNNKMLGIKNNKEVPDHLIDLYSNNEKLLSLNAFEAELGYKGINKRVYGNSNSWFDIKDIKKIEATGMEDYYELKISWFNASKDPTEIGYVFRLFENNSIIIRAFAKPKEVDKLGQFGYGVSYNEKIGIIYSPTGKILSNDRKSNNDEELSSSLLEIPIKPNKIYEKMLFNDSDMVLNFTFGSTLMRVKNLFEWQVSRFYISTVQTSNDISEYAPLRIELLTGSGLRNITHNNTIHNDTIHNDLRLISDGISKNAGSLFYKTEKVLDFDAGEGRISINGTSNRVAGDDSSGLFSRNDLKKVTISEAPDSYYMDSSWTNPTKNPATAGYLFSLPKNNQYLKVYMYLNSSEKPFAMTPGFIADGYDIYLKNDTILRNDRKSTIISAMDEYEIFYKNNTAFILASKDVSYMHHLFEWQVFRPVLSHQAPLYFIYFPNISLDIINNIIYIKSDVYCGSADDYVREFFKNEDMYLVHEKKDLQSIHGAPLTAESGKIALINENNFPEFHNYLRIYFSKDGYTEKNNATYISTFDEEMKGWFLGKWYKSLKPDKADLISRVLMDDGEKVLRANESWNLPEDYSLTYLMSEKSNLVLLRLMKNNNIVEESVIEKGNSFEYKKNINGIYVVLFKARVAGFLGGNDTSILKLENIYQYSDEPLEIKVGDTYGEFEVSRITSNKIELKNAIDITFSPGGITSILDGTIKFKMASKSYRAYPFMESNMFETLSYRSAYKIEAEDSVHFDATLYSGFHYDLEKGISFEDFDGNLSLDNTFHTDSATYTATAHEGRIWYIGREYATIDNDNPSRLKMILIDTEDKITLNSNRTNFLEEGYELIFSDVAIDSASVVFELKKDGKIVEIETVKKDDYFVYKKDIGGLQTEVIKFKVIGIFQEEMNVVQIKDLIQYSDKPVIIKEGDRFGEFEVKQITSSQIVLKNIVPIQLPLDTETAILNGAIKFKNEPYTRIIDNGIVSVKARQSAGDYLAAINYKYEKVFTLNAWEPSLTYDGTEKRLHEWFADSADQKKVEIKREGDYQELKIYFYNTTGNIRKAGYIIRINNSEDRINIKFFAQALNDSKLKDARYALNFDSHITQIIMQGGILENDGKTNYFLNGYAIPINRQEGFNFDNSYIKGSAILFYGMSTKVSNWFQYQVTHVYIPRKDNDYAPIYLDFSDTPLSRPYLTPDIRVSEKQRDRSINMYYNNKLIMDFNAWEGEVTYNGSIKRIHGDTGSDSWFDSNDTKKIETNEQNDSYQLKTYWYNETKDPNAIGYVFTIFKNKTFLTVRMYINSSDSLKIGRIGPGFVTNGYDIYLVNGTILMNDNESNYFLIPPENNEIFYNNKSMIFLYINSTINMKNYFKYQVFRSNINDFQKSMFIEYLPDAEIDIRNNSLYIKTHEFNGTTNEYIDQFYK